MSHISCVQTLVKASGKKSSKVFFLPKLLLSFTSTRPEACLDLRAKSGALVPTDNGIRVFTILDFRCSISWFIGRVSPGVKLRFVFKLTRFSWPQKGTRATKGIPF